MRHLCKASHECIVQSYDTTTHKHIGGSASYVLNVDMLPVRKVVTTSVRHRPIDRVQLILLADYGNYVAGEIIKESVESADILIKAGLARLHKHHRGMNKSKLRAKIHAYSSLKDSKKFLAFYSISFPKGMPDDCIRQVHNTVLTRIRKMNTKFTYIWIAERQKNGTLHFHMLTNSFLNIRVINHMYAVAIENILKKCNISHVNYNKSKYNGVDVKKVYSTKNLCNYMAKYVTKNKSKSIGLLWNCHASVSALVTHLYLDHDTFIRLLNKIVHLYSIYTNNSNSHYNMSFDVYTYAKYRPKIIFESLDIINEYVYKDVMSRLLSN